MLTPIAKTLLDILERCDGDLFRMTADTLSRYYQRQNDSDAIPSLVALILTEGQAGGERRFAAESAAKALVGLGEEGVQAILDLLKHEHASIQKIAIDALEYAPDVRAAEPLIALLEDRERDETKESPHEALIAIGPAAIPSLLRCLQRAEGWSIRCSAASVLDGIKVRVPEATPLLLQMLAQAQSLGIAKAASDRETIDFDGLHSIIGALGSVGDMSSVPILQNLFQDLRWVQYHESILLALGQLKSPVTLELIRTMLEEPTRLDDWAEHKARGFWLYETDPNLPRGFRFGFEQTAVTALGYTGDAQAIPLIRSVLDRVAVDEEIRRRGKDGEELPDSPEPSAGEYPLEQRAELQTVCALSLTELGAPDALEALLRCLYCSGIWLDGETLDDGFLRIGRTAIPDLIALLEEVPDAGPRVRTNVASVLANMPDDRAVPALIAQLGYIYQRRGPSHPDEETMAQFNQALVRGAAAKALGAIGDSRATEPLLALLKEYGNHRLEIYVVPESIKALGKIKDPRAAPALAQRLYNGDKYHPGKVGEYNEDAVKALRSLGPVAFPAVRALLKQEAAAWRCAAAIALGLLGDQDSASALQTLAEIDPDPTVRDAARVACISLEFSDSLPGVG